MSNAEFSRFSRMLGRAEVLAPGELDLTNDVILVMDASDPNGKLKRMSPNGLLSAFGSVVEIPLITCRTATGLVLTATPGAGVFGISLTPGTSLALTGETASSNTKTDKVVAEVTLPVNYLAGENVTLRVNAKETGVATVKTIDASAWEQSTAGAASADLVITNAQNLTTADAAYDFVIDGTNLLPGDKLLIQLTTVITEEAAGSAIPSISSIRLVL